MMGRNDRALKPLKSVNKRLSANAARDNKSGEDRQLASSRPKPRNTLTGMTALAVIGREHMWLWDFRQGMSTNAIASRESVSIRRVRIGIARASARERRCPKNTKNRLPWLVPLFPIGPYTPRSICGHRKPIVSGSVLCCMICHRSGWDEHPAMQCNPETDPAPEPRLPSLAHHASPETRRERRQRLFGAPRLTALYGINRNSYHARLNALTNEGYY